MYLYSLDCTLEVKDAFNLTSLKHLSFFSAGIFVEDTFLKVFLGCLIDCI